ncbi:tetratricopeptide repeat protein [Belliella baltica]|uniref:tetratricopeptide repeat protein n=1 Tax=Belliella baltica TaxID=232259 RepID=UPI001FDF645B|nr:tetratricopeptide repeat protein [Belliella baltica]
MIAILGGLFLLLSLFFWQEASMPVLPGVFAEEISVPLQFFKLGTELINIEVNNFLLFQNFESLPPILDSKFSLIYGALIVSLLGFGLTLLSTLKKMYFIGSTAGVIFFFTFTVINGLNISGLSTNYPLIILLVGTIIPLVFIHFFKTHWDLSKRILVILPSFILTLIVLLYFAKVNSAQLFLSENITLPVAFLAVLFMFHIGHAVVSSSSIFLIKLNQGLKLKISWHITILSILYFFLVLFTLLSIMGEVNLPFPTLPPSLLFLVSGIFGYFVLEYKISQTEQIFDHHLVGKSFYLIGFAMTSWTWGKAIYTFNEPLIEFFNHTFLYGQIALTLLFFAYLLTNFSSILNSGGALEKVIFKPQHFAYFHMRIGATMLVVILIIFANGVIATQLTAASANLYADYNYQIGNLRNARILYENSWMEYFKNDRAKNTVAHIYLEENQNSSALRHLEESFDYAPNVPNILLISSMLHKSDKILEAIFYLEKGLEYYPNDPKLLNNLALLYSKINKPDQAIAALENISTSKEIKISNTIALSIKHNLTVPENMNLGVDKITKINQLALANKLGNFADFTLDTKNLPEQFVIKSSLLRNQWTNQAVSDFEIDLGIIDSLVKQNQTAYEERNYWETKVIRSHQGNEIDETLKYLSGSTFSFPNHAAAYHVMAGEILASQLDFEKAAIDFKIAAADGYKEFKPFHLAILYFSGKIEEALALKEKQQVNFPSWMEWDENGALIQNQQVKYYQILKTFHQSISSKIIKSLSELTDSELKSELAFFVMIHKAHSLKKDDFESLEQILTNGDNAVWTKEEFEELTLALLEGKSDIKSDKVSRIIKPNLSLIRNSYLTPLVMQAVQKEEDSLKKYEILQEAIQFNKDPILWMAFVKESRINGLGNYGTKAVEEMAAWLSNEELEKLMMENL